MSLKCCGLSSGAQGSKMDEGLSKCEMLNFQSMHPSSLDREYGPFWTNSHIQISSVHFVFADGASVCLLLAG